MTCKLLLLAAALLALTGSICARQLKWAGDYESGMTDPGFSDGGVLDETAPQDWGADSVILPEGGNTPQDQGNPGPKAQGAQFDEAGHTLTVPGDTKPADQQNPCQKRSSGDTFTKEHWQGMANCVGDGFNKLGEGAINGIQKVDKAGIVDKFGGAAATVFGKIGSWFG